MIVLRHFIYNAIKPYLTPAVSGSTLKVADFCPPTLNFNPLTTLHADDTGHDTTDTRPSRFSCAILKSWEWPEDEAMKLVLFSNVHIHVHL